MAKEAPITLEVIAYRLDEVSTKIDAMGKDLAELKEWTSVK